MKTRIAVVVACCCVFGGILAFAGDSQDKSSLSELDMLKKQFKALEKRVAAIEEQLKKKQQLPIIRTPQTFPFPEMQRLPKGWQRKEFNGIPYYIIPLNEIVPLTK
jgi:hypothetical protein